MQSRKESTLKPKSSPSNGFQAVRNKILLSLPPFESSLLFERMEFVNLPVRTTLSEPMEPIENAYFIESGLASVLSIANDEKAVEVGLCGNEGFVGLPLIAGLRSSATRTFMQVAGSGYRIETSHFSKVLEECPDLRIALMRFEQIAAMQAGQIAACNRMHKVDSRTARWLAMSQDRLGGDVIPLTQEFLAHMLGARRASVSEAVSSLERTGMIAHRRGALHVKDRRALVSAACECYKIIVEQIKKWESEV